MSLMFYKFISSYRGINKTKKEGQTKYPEFYNFKKDDIVAAEVYNPNNIQGVTFSKQMMLVMNSYIVPATVLNILKGEELKAVIDGLDKNESNQQTSEEQAIDLKDIDSSKADIIEGKTIKNIIGNGANVGKGAMIGGIAGFGVAYFTKQNKWLGVLIGVLAGSSIALIYNHNKKVKESKKKEEDKQKTNE